MRWESLFADLEAQAAAAARAELEAEVDDRSRRELAALRLTDRLRAASEAGTRLTVAVGGGDPLTGRVAALGRDWLLLADTGGGDVLVPAGAVLWVSGLSRTASHPSTGSPVARELSLGYALRTVARDRSAVSVLTRDGATVTGTIDGVGGDFVELGQPAPAARRAVTFAALAWVRAAG